MSGSQKDKEALIKTGIQSDKVFLLPTSQEAEATEVFRMNHKLRDPATETHLVKDLHTSLVSVPKLADADYITVLDKKGAKIYDGYTTTIKVLEKAVLEGYRCKGTGLMRIPLKAKVTNENTDTLLIDRPNPEHAIGHVFELPSTENNSPIF